MSSLHNPDFPTTDADIRRDRERMMAEPVGLVRPLIVLDGWHAPGIAARFIAEDLRRLTGADRAMVLRISYPAATDFRKSIPWIIERIDDRWPSSDPRETVEVDVVGISMGGLVARAAEMPDGYGVKRLRIRRLFTLSTPHRGARMAAYLRLDPSSALMTPGSPFLARLDRRLSETEMEIVSYARLNDWLVGARNCAPPGQEPIWTNGPWLLSHFTMSRDKRAIADIARRLRNEPPLGWPGLPPPTD